MAEPVRRAPADGPIVVGVLYPREWYGNPDRFAEVVAALEGIDQRIEVVVEGYEESHELRTARGKPGAGDLREKSPPLSDDQRAALGRLHVAVAIDLPFDVAGWAPELRWVQAVGAGTGQLQSAGLADAGIRLTSAAGANSVGIAEFALARVLQEWKRFRQMDAAQERHAWEPLFGQQLSGCTLGLIGLGAINSAIASRAQAFDLHVLATRRSATPGATAPNVDELYPTSELTSMLARCDAVIAAVPETSETMGLMDAGAIAAMKPGAFFCNVGRGSLVDEEALIAALEDGRLRGAALDVASVEPLPPDHPLWDAPNLYLSPHAASSPAALFVNLHELFGENVRRFVAGEPLLNEVDVTQGY